MYKNLNKLYLYSIQNVCLLRWNCKGLIHSSVHCTLCCHLIAKAFWSRRSFARAHHSIPLALLFSSLCLHSTGNVSRNVDGRARDVCARVCARECTHIWVCVCVRVSNMFICLFLFGLRQKLVSAKYVHVLVRVFSHMCVCVCVWMWGSW